MELFCFIHNLWLIIISVVVNYQGVPCLLLYNTLQGIHIIVWDLTDCTFLYCEFGGWYVGRISKYRIPYILESYNRTKNWDVVIISTHEGKEHLMTPTIKFRGCKMGKLNRNNYNRRAYPVLTPNSDTLPKWDFQLLSRSLHFLCLLLEKLLWILARLFLMKRFYAMNLTRHPCFRRVILVLDINRTSAFGMISLYHSHLLSGEAWYWND